MDKPFIVDDDIANEIREVFAGSSVGMPIFYEKLRERLIQDVMVDLRDGRVYGKLIKSEDVPPEK